MRGCTTDLQCEARGLSGARAAVLDVRLVLTSALLAVCCSALYSPLPSSPLPPPLSSSLLSLPPPLTLLSFTVYCSPRSSSPPDLSAPCVLDR